VKLGEFVDHAHDNCLAELLMIKKILVPLDGSDHSRKIVSWATGLARALGAEITLLTVIDEAEIEILEATPRKVLQATKGSKVQTAQTASEIVDDAISATVSELEREVGRITSLGLTVQFRVTTGSPAEAIVSQAHSSGVDLIAMATNRESALARGVLGSVTDRVLHSTPIPVLTMYPGEAQVIDGTIATPSRVIVPLDGSGLSQTAVQPATEIAKAAGAEIVFIEVLRLPLLGVGVAGIEYGAGDYAGDLGIDSQKQEISQYLQRFVSEAEESGLKATASIRTGSPAQQIVEEAGETENSIVVMGSHGAGGLKRWVVGSVADKVIRSARRPVLVIPPKTG
jgi:nucleotide-binding universal stress UspA family protein